MEAATSATGQIIINRISLPQQGASTGQRQLTYFLHRSYNRVPCGGSPRKSHPLMTGEPNLVSAWAFEERCDCGQVAQLKSSFVGNLAEAGCQLFAKPAVEYVSQKLPISPRMRPSNPMPPLASMRNEGSFCAP